MRYFGFEKEFLLGNRSQHLILVIYNIISKNQNLHSSVAAVPLISKYFKIKYTKLFCTIEIFIIILLLFIDYERVKDTATTVDCAHIFI